MHSDLEVLLARATAFVETLERSSIKFTLDGNSRAAVASDVRGMIDEIASLRAERDGLREALEPFAMIAPHVEQTDQRDGNCVHRQHVMTDGKISGWMELSMDDFRRARAALQHKDIPNG